MAAPVPRSPPTVPGAKGVWFVADLVRSRAGNAEASASAPPPFALLGPGWDHDAPGLLIYAVHTKPRQEKALATRLSAEGVACYLPLTKRIRSWEHRRRTVHEPLFSSYLFVRGTVDQTYQVLGSKRAVKVLPAPDQGLTLHELRQIDLAIRGGATLDPYPFLEPGKRVIVARGPLRGVEGEVYSRSGPHRVVLKISTLGRAVSLEIDSAAVDPQE